MKRTLVPACAILLLATASAVGASRQEVLDRAAARWMLGDGGKGAAVPLKQSGEIEVGVDAEGEGALPGGKAARMSDAYFDAGKDLTVTGNGITVYLRARDPKGQWRYGLFCKRGGHDVVTFNLFSVDLGGTPGPDIGFEVHSRNGFVMVSFPVSDINAVAWHDFAGRYDGKTIEVICDGKVMAKKWWKGGDLTQNAEPVLIGAETDNGQVVRPFTGEMEEAALWSHALRDDEVAVLMRKESVMPCTGYVEPYASPIHYRPEMGRLADTIPFFWQGQYHIFYLRAIEKVPWEHIVSTNLIHWRELPTALAPDGKPDGPDGLHMFTGSVTEKDGAFHIFYTGWNPANREGREWVMHATSPDLITWTKHPEQGFRGDEIHYQNLDFRDPYVFWNDGDKRYWMILCARDAKTGKPVQGVAVSNDLVKWEQVEPLTLEPPLGDGTPECPDLFKIVVSHVPFVDVMNTMLDASLPLTVGEYLEWGNPNEACAYHYIRTYCPYTNVSPQRYPALLVTAGLNDPRVSYWEAAKWVARLRAVKLNDSVLILRTNMGAGHSGASGRYDAWKEQAFRYAFILNQLGIDG